jgi:hypothetical protein
MERYLPEFIQIPRPLIEDEELQPLDLLSYGVIHWQTKLALRKCIISNEALAKMLRSTKGSIANSISRLAKCGYIRVVLDSDNHRKEILPLIEYRKVDEGGSLKNEGGPSSFDEQNKRSPNKNIPKKESSKEKRVSRENAFSPEAIEALKVVFPSKDVKAEVEKAADYLEATGKSYQNYTAYLRNWLRNSRDIRKPVPADAEIRRKAQTPPEEFVPKTEEEIARRSEIIAKKRAEFIARFGEED